MTLCYGFRTSKMLFKIVRRYKVTYYYSRPALDGTITYYGHRHFFSCYEEKICGLFLIPSQKTIIIFI